MKKVYICGPVTGLPYGEVQYQFNRAETMLKGMGLEPINPVTVVPDCLEPWPSAMRKCIKAMMDADMVLLLDGWTKSRGAQLEVHLAQSLNMRVFEIMYFESAIALADENDTLGARENQLHPHR